MSKKEVREANYHNAQVEIAKVIRYLEDIKTVYFKPARLQEETNAVNRAVQNLDRVVRRLTKRIEISKHLSK